MRPYRLALTLAFLFAAALPARATDDPSLKLVPADVSFYSSSLHLGEQMDLFLKSNAYARLRAVPALKVAAEHLHEHVNEPGNPLGPVVQFFHDPANHELIELLHDLPRQEIFVYGGANWARLLPVLLDANWAQQLAPLKALIAGKDPSKSQLRAILHVLNASADKLAIPDLVIGFKLSKADPAVAQIKRLEGLLAHLATQVAQLKGRVKRVQVGGADALTLTLDGSQIPLDSIPWTDIEEQEGEFQKVRLRVKTLTLTISLLVKDDYLLLTVGPHAGVAEAFGRGPALASRPELAPLAKFADRKLIAVGYVSQVFAAGSATNGENVLGVLDTIKDGLDKLPIPEARREAIDKDLKQLVKDATASLPKPGAALSFSFLTARGQEGYSYDYGITPGAVAPKPLTILDHFGGSPLIAIAGQVNDPTIGYRALVKFLTVVYGHLDAVAKEMVPEQVYQQSKQGVDMVLPFLKKFDEITGTMFLPALGAGEAALVLDAKWTSKQWYKDLDQHGKALPMLEVGIVRTVQDSAKLVKAFQAYRDLVNEVLTKAKEFGASRTGRWVAEAGGEKDRRRDGLLLAAAASWSGQAGAAELRAIGKSASGHLGGETQRAAVDSDTAEDRWRAAHGQTAGGVGGISGLGRTGGCGSAVGRAASPAGGAGAGAGQRSARGDAEGDSRPGGDAVRRARLPAQVHQRDYREGRMTVTHSELVIRDLK